MAAPRNRRMLLIFRYRPCAFSRLLGIIWLNHKCTGVRHVRACMCVHKCHCLSLAYHHRCNIHYVTIRNNVPKNGSQLFTLCQFTQNTLEGQTRQIAKRMRPQVIFPILFRLDAEGNNTGKKYKQNSAHLQCRLIIGNHPCCREQGRDYPRYPQTHPVFPSQPVSVIINIALSFPGIDAARLAELLEHMAMAGEWSGCQNYCWMVDHLSSIGRPAMFNRIISFHSVCHWFPIVWRFVIYSPPPPPPPPPHTTHTGRSDSHQPSALCLIQHLLFL